MSYLVSFCSCVSSPFSIAISSLGEEKANLNVFRTFVVLVWICRFPLPLGVWEGLRFVIVALPGLFSYLFLMVPKTDFKSFQLSFRYLCDPMNIKFPYFKGMLTQIYPTELQLKGANTADTESVFLSLQLLISNVYISN